MAFLGSCSSKTLRLSSPNKDIQVEIRKENKAKLTYNVFKNNKVILEDSKLGLHIESLNLGTDIRKISLIKKSEENTTFPIKGIKKEANHHSNHYLFEIKEANGF